MAWLLTFFLTLDLSNHSFNTRRNACLILGLDPNTCFTKAQLKQAYRTRLLQIHPDKQKNTIPQQTNSDSASSNLNSLSVDDICQSFYLLQQELSQSPQKSPNIPVFYETVCFEDFIYSSSNDEFYLNCRCGDMFILNKQEINQGQAIVSCNGCSLWIRVISNSILK